MSYEWIVTAVVGGAAVLYTVAVRIHWRLAVGSKQVGTLHRE